VEKMLRGKKFISDNCHTHSAAKDLTGIYCEPKRDTQAGPPQAMQKRIEIHEAGSNDQMTALGHYVEVVWAALVSAIFERLIALTKNSVIPKPRGLPR
jgi:hypothetical protein